MNDPTTSGRAGEVRVRQLMRSEVLTVGPDTTVRELVRVLAERKIGGVPVVGEDGELVGIVTTTDLVRLAADAADVPLGSLLEQAAPAAFRDQTESLLSFLATDAWGDSESLAPRSGASADTELDYQEYRVRDIMRRALVTVEPDQPLSGLARVLLESHVHRAPVVEDGRLVGIVTTFDVLRAVAGGAPVAGMAEEA